MCVCVCVYVYVSTGWRERAKAWRKWLIFYFIPSQPHRSCEGELKGGWGWGWRKMCLAFLWNVKKSMLEDKLDSRRMRMLPWASCGPRHGWCQYCTWMSLTWPVVCVPPDSPVPVGGAGGSLAGVFPEPEPVWDFGGEPGASAHHHRPAAQQPAWRRGGTV